MDVPLRALYPPFGTLLTTSTPGAEMFGFVSSPKAERPQLEKLAMLPELSKAPAE